MKTFYTIWGWCCIIVAVPTFFINLLVVNICEEHNHTYLGSLLTLGIIVISYIILYFINYFIQCPNDDNTINMKFSHFKDAYYVNPKRWAMPYEEIMTSSWGSFNGSPCLRYYFYNKNRTRTIYNIHFSFLDWNKFRLWRIGLKLEKMNIKHKKREIQKNQNLAEMLKNIQKDIDEAYSSIEKGSTATKKDPEIIKRSIEIIHYNPTTGEEYAHYYDC